MRIMNLKLKGVGPFKEEILNFINNTDNLVQPPVTIITGENGTGKTIILDAIRGLLFGENSHIGRDIFNGENIELSMLLHKDGKGEQINFNKFTTHLPRRLQTNNRVLNSYFLRTPQTPNWIVSYWDSNLGGGTFDIKNLTAPNTTNILQNALSGKIDNIHITALMVFFDYLQDSKNPQEQRLGTFVYNKLKEIIGLCLNDGELAYVSRTDLKPIVRQNGKVVSLDKLSSGNLYLVQRMVDLLGKMYAITVSNNKPIEELCHTKGVLLIDEAENHLHPKWQKTFVGNILKIFPNLQIILTTHSPFIVASVENAKIFVCESATDHCVIKDKTAQYANLPIEEILMSPLFGYTPTFNQRISDLLANRKQAIQNKQFELKEQIEKQLQQINPEYFAFFDIDKMLHDLNPELSLTK